MNGNFEQTRMGQEFYDGTMKSINKNLDRIATALELIAAGQNDNQKLLSDIKESLLYLR